MSDNIFVKFSDDFLSQYKTKEVFWGFGALSYITYKRTYARDVEGENRKEEWWETIKRCIEGAQEINAKYTIAEAHRLYDLMFNLKCSYAGRPLWQLGTNQVRRFGGNSLLNCFAYETKILTKQGWFQIGSLAGTEHEVLTSGGKWIKAPINSFGVQKLYKIEYLSLDELCTVYATAEHNWIVINRDRSFSKIKTIDLKPNMELPYVVPANEFDDISPELRQMEKPICVISVEETDREEEVFCATVPGTHSFVIESNCLTSNCWFTTIDNIESFIFLFDNLMLGGGVGFSVKREHVHELPKVKDKVKITHENTNDAQFIVPDSREGWSELLRKVFESYFITGKSFTYSTILVRGHGEKIRTFGGVASGPLPLIESIEDICKVLDNRAGKKIRSLDALDICNLLGRIVVSGNVRRCIREGSKVKTKNGEKNIEDIKVGDKVLTPNGWKKVINLFKQGKQECVRIKHANGEIDCTINHRLAQYHDGTKDRIKYMGDPKKGFIQLPETPYISWIKPEWLLFEQKHPIHPDLKFDSRLVQVNDYYQVSPVEILSITNLDGEYETYDIEVEDDHCFMCEGVLVHNSAEIAIGDVDDVLFLRAKRWDLGALPSWRSNSNNSIYCDDISELLPHFWEGYNGNGESYGLININNCRKYGRIGEKRIDKNAEGMNPCFAYETPIITSDGEIEIGQWAENGNVREVWDGNEWVKAKAFYTGERKVIKLSLSNGEELKLTPDHMVYDFSNFPIMAKDSLDMNLKKMDIYDPDNDYDDDRESVYVEEIEECGVESVYDFSMEKTHTASVCGIKVHNCGEIPLSNYECCNLQEIFLNNISNEEELIDCATLLYKTSKAICLLPFLHDETNKIVHKNMRIGIGITGVCQSLNKVDWLNNAYNKLREFDTEWSKKNNYPESIRLTTIKPSGTVSLLAGATPGVHPGFARYHIRRIRFSSNNELVDMCRKAGYFVEYSTKFDGTIDYNTSIVSFPCEFKGDEVIVEDQMSIEKQMDLVKQMQTVWSDNAVSCTIYYEKDELGIIKDWLSKNYKDCIKSISFCLKNDSGFKQMPLEEISKEEFDKMVKSIKPINLSAEKEEGIDVGECSGGACPIK